MEIKEYLNKHQLLVVDGSMSTPLEAMGYNLNDKLWTAKILVNNPELIKKVHTDYFNAGAHIGITCSYQATILGLIEAGYSQEEAENYIKKSVTLFKEARDEFNGDFYPLCLASIGPYGAYKADGSEYRGHYNISNEELENFHKRKVEILWEEQPDFLLFETVPSLNEALIQSKLAEDINADYIISFSCIDGKHTCEGQLIEDCAKQLNDTKVSMIGINCSDPKYIEELITIMKQYTNKPIIVYPNSGDIYDPVTKTWTKNNEGLSFKEYANLYYKVGASAVGGCCTTTASHIKEVSEVREKILNSKLIQV